MDLQIDHNEEILVLPCLNDLYFLYKHVINTLDSFIINRVKVMKYHIHVCCTNEILLYTLGNGCGNKHNMFLYRNSKGSLYLHIIVLTIHIAACQMSGDSVKPPWLQAVTRHRPCCALLRVTH